MTSWLTHLFGLPTPGDVGFLLCIAMACVLGWMLRDIRIRRERARRVRAFWRGEK